MAVTFKQKWKLFTSKKKLPQLIFAMGLNFAGHVKWKFVRGYKFGETYVLPDYGYKKIPLPPRGAIQDVVGADGIVWMLVPERNFLEYLNVNIQKNDKGVIEWIKMPEYIEKDITSTIRKDAEFKLLYMQEQKEIEAEKKMLSGLLEKYFPIIAGLIAVIALAIIVMVAQKSITKVMIESKNIMIETAKLVAQHSASSSGSAGSGGIF